MILNSGVSRQWVEPSRSAEPGSPNLGRKTKTNKQNPQILSWSPLNTLLEGILLLLIEHPLISSTKYDISLPCTSSFCVCENGPFQYLDNTSTTEKCSKWEREKSNISLLVGLSKPHRLIKIAFPQMSKVTFAPNR